ncbi:pathogenesis-related homeodomain protein-like [Camellia sinensis]|uniref:pathogenesis-related homeodomain protein-like n=1 Tax=Camellia sinensis TaxID=4442 RepID=UPI00103553D7|nr:pathogenesis-related homeodomain protein-like [Camellia sinensis]
MQHSQGESEHTPKKRAHEELDVEGTNNSPAKFYERGSNGTSTKRFGEAVTQGLAKSFNENHYPDRAMKEKLATELEITVKQVSKWFANARWKFHHPLPARQRSTTSGVRKRKSTPDDHQGSG